jgi:hypothetical protein
LKGALIGHTAIGSGLRRLVMKPFWHFSVLNNGKRKMKKSVFQFIPKLDGFSAKRALHAVLQRHLHRES